MILYAAADLLWSTRIKSTADAMSAPCRPVRSLEMLEARLVDSPVKTVLLDLDAHELAFVILRRIHKWNHDHHDRAIKTIAWGPHVEVDLLTEARQLGCDRVLTRGQFANELTQILAADPDTSSDTSEPGDETSE